MLFQIVCPPTFLWLLGHGLIGHSLMENVVCTQDKKDRIAIHNK